MKRSIFLGICCIALSLLQSGCAAIGTHMGADQHSASTVFAAGEAAYGRGDWPAAEIHFRVLAERVPADSLAPFKLGNALAHQGRLDEAAAAYQAALQRDPQFAKAASNLATVYLMLASQALRTAMTHLPPGDGNSALLALRERQIRQIADIPVDERNGSGMVLNMGQAP